MSVTSLRHYAAWAPWQIAPVGGYTRPKAEGAETTADAIPRLLTIREAYTTLRISKWALYQLIRSRQLRTIKIGRRRVVPVTAIEALVRRLQSEEEV